MSKVLLEGRWSETKEALLEGLKGTRKSTMSVILENTKKQLLAESSAGTTTAGNIATMLASSASFGYLIFLVMNSWKAFPPPGYPGIFSISYFLGCWVMSIIKGI
jgi:hypothetical protein